jgi:EmrB/QacA subfamily drug resistance transporter
MKTIGRLAVGLEDPAHLADMGDPACPDADPGDTAAPKRPHLAMAVLMSILFLTFLDNTVISATLSDIQSGLHAGVTQLQWVVSGYALTFASLMLICGTLGDLFGRKRLMLIGVTIFCAGSVVAAVATSTTLLIIGRVVMGVGAAASEPGTLSMIRHLYPERKPRARALGTWAAVSGLALALGPVIGGGLVGFWSWRAVFWFNLAFGAVALVAAAIVLPERADPVKARLDWGGFFLGAAALATATFATIMGETAGYITGWILLLYGLSVMTVIAFILVELRVQNPMLDVRFFKRPPFAGSTVVAFSTYFGIFSIFFFVALYLEVVGNASPYALALDFIPMTVGMVLASLLTGRWVALVGNRTPMTVGCVVAAAGIILTDVVISPNSAISSVGWTLAVAGIGFGMAIVPVTSSALSSVPARALRHGRLYDQHQPGARGGRRGGHPGDHRQRPTHRQPHHPVGGHRHPARLPIPGDRRGDHRFPRIPGSGFGREGQCQHPADHQRGGGCCLRRLRARSGSGPHRFRRAAAGLRGGGLLHHRVGSPTPGGER